MEDLEKLDPQRKTDKSSDKSQRKRVKELASVLKN